MYISMILSVEVKYKAESLEEFCFGLHESEDVVATEAFVLSWNDVTVHFITRVTWRFQDLTVVVVVVVFVILL